MPRHRKEQLGMAERAFGGMSKPQALRVLESLVADPLPKDLDVSKQIERLGRLVDLAEDFARLDGVDRAVTAGESLLQQPIHPSDKALLHYTLGNSFAVRSHLSTAARVSWEDGDVARQIIHLRLACRAERTTGLDQVRACQALTNLGNLMSQCGRFADALYYWDKALRIQPHFSMAHGNRGWGLMRYGAHLGDPGHQALHFREAYRSLSRALSEPWVRLMDHRARDYFADRLALLVSKVGKETLTAPPHEHPWPDQMSAEERAYRKWCLRMRLFVNDLNDLGSDPIAAADVLTLPSLTRGRDEGLPSALGMFNQLKQAFVSARFLYYEGAHATSTHFSDRDVTLINAFDYSAYGLASEKARLAYRSAYSILDQIAFLLNDYLCLGIPERSVSFKALWYTDKTQQAFRPELAARLDNEGLQALFWVSKDFHERGDGEFMEALEPDARELADIRNHLEHKYLTLHMLLPPAPRAERRAPFLGDRDPLAFSMTRDDFLRRTVRVLGLVRGALVYLALAMTTEERGKGSRPAGERRIASITLEAMPDDQKC